MVDNRMCGALVLGVAGLFLQACVSSGDVLGTVGLGGDGIDGILEDPSSGPDTLGDWETISLGEVVVGYQNSTHRMSTEFDEIAGRWVIKVAQPGRPRTAGTWTGRWKGETVPFLGQSVQGFAEVTVSITEDNEVYAVLAYEGVPGLERLESDLTSIDSNGVFRPEISLTLQGVEPLTYRGEGRFGGENQAGVAGYMHGEGLRSLFFGDRHVEPEENPLDGLE